MEQGSARPPDTRGVGRMQGSCEEGSGRTPFSLSAFPASGSPIQHSPRPGTCVRSRSHTPSHKPTTQKGSQRGCKPSCKKDFPLLMTAALTPERILHHCILQDVCSLTDPLC